MGKPNYEGIVEIIKNENGTAIKYSDGTMICRKNVPVTNATIGTNWGGGIYISGTLYIGSFAESFIEPPDYTYSWVSKKSAWLMPQGGGSYESSSAGIALQLVSVGSQSGVNGYINVIAVGRWK